MSDMSLLLQHGQMDWTGAMLAGLMMGLFITPLLILGSAVEVSCCLASAVMDQKIRTIIGLMLFASLL